MSEKQHTFEEITSHLVTSGFVYPGSEIYGGLSNSWDYGPLGALLKNHVKDLWLRHFVRGIEYNVQIDPAIIMNPKVWDSFVSTKKKMQNTSFTVVSTILQNVMN